MKPVRFICALFFFNLVLSSEMVAQSTGGGWSKNVSLLAKTNFGRGASSDVWGWKDSQTGKHYALVTLNRGLSIIDVSNPNSISLSHKICLTRAQDFSIIYTGGNKRSTQMLALRSFPLESLTLIPDIRLFQKRLDVGNFCFEG